MTAYGARKLEFRLQENGEWIDVTNHYAGLTIKPWVRRPDYDEETKRMYEIFAKEERGFIEGFFVSSSTNAELASQFRINEIISKDISVIEIGEETTPIAFDDIEIEVM